jgi:glyoxylase-like metal-dependent hydrolase (beta-lactamase superfamily II)
VPGHTPGSMAVLLETEGKKVLFGQDIHGPYVPAWGADPARARESLRKLLSLKADILCEGHFGVYQPAAAVADYVRGYVESL